MVANPFKRKQADAAAAGVGTAGHGYDSPTSQDENIKGDKYQDIDDSKITFVRFRILAMLIIVSMGGTIFGYDTGQISGFVQMPDFIQRFGNNGGFSNWKEGTIVGLLSIGTLFGAIATGSVADRFGRKIAIIFFNIIFIVGVIVQIASTYTWYQIALGRWVAGIGVGGLSVLTPMYQSETAPKQIRGALVSAYQLFITFGIFLAYCINLGTEARPNASAWRIPMGIGFIFPVFMAVGIVFLPESPRWDYRNGRTERARKSIALAYGVPENHREVVREIREIKEKFDAENIGGPHPWYEVFTGPRMAYRTALGMVLQALQQLTGANFFFYYGTTVFQNIGTPGLQNPFVTSLILGTINFGCTFLGLYVVDRFGRRKALIPGSLWMFVCFMIFSSVGNFSLEPTMNAKTGPEAATKQTAATVMIIFTCLFIFGYAITWAPIVWALVGEIYPSRYRATSMGLATTANWTFNFLLAFFTPYITSSIHYRYGYIFAACNFAGALVVYFFVPESQGRTLEEIDTMYVLHVKPWQSSKWQPPEGESIGDTDAAYLRSGGRDIQKAEGGGEQQEKAEV